MTPFLYSMTKIIRDDWNAYEILNWHEDYAEGTLLEFRDRSSVLAFLRRFKGDYFAMMSFRDFLADGLYCLNLSRMSDQEVFELLARRLLSGEARIASLPVTTLALGSKHATTEPGMSEAVPVAPTMVAQEATFRQAAEDKKDWIEIYLVDDLGQPVIGAKYRIELPDGEKVEGLLDGNGRARHANIQSGDCVVIFPDYGTAEIRKTS